MTLSAVSGVAIISLGLVLTPGPNMIYLVTRSLSQGRRAGLISLIGVAAALAVYLVATTLGLVALFAAVPTLFVVVKLLGACYLLHLAWTALRPGGRSMFTRDDSPPLPARSLLLMGFLTCLLNPKIALMYAALLPQFVDADRAAAPQLLTLGLVQVAIAVTVNAAWVVAAGWVAITLRRRPGALRAQRLLTGAALAGFAVHLALSPSATSSP